jgi:hypothetical protein
MSCGQTSSAPYPFFQKYCIAAGGLCRNTTGACVCASKATMCPHAREIRLRGVLCSGDGNCSACANYFCCIQNNVRISRFSFKAPESSHVAPERGSEISARHPQTYNREEAPCSSCAFPGVIVYHCNAGTI